MENDGNTFPGSSSTLQEDIVAMVIDSKRKRAPNKPETNTTKTKSSDSDAEPRKKVKFPPFVKFFKSSSGDDAVKFKIGDSKVWNGETWYFCDCPNHREKHKWHPHKPEDCRTRKKWKENADVPIGNLGDATDTAGDHKKDNDTVPDTSTVSTIGTGSTNSLHVMLANALAVSQDNPIANELIADALNAINNG